MSTTLELAKGLIYPTRTGLSPAVEKLFDPRPPLEFKKTSSDRHIPPFVGVAEYMKVLEGTVSQPLEEPHEPPRKRKKRLRELKEREHKAEAEQLKREWKPIEDGMVKSDPRNTILVARLAYETTEHKLRRVFEEYGMIKSLRIVRNKITDKPIGYAFVEYEKERDKNQAFKYGHGVKIDGRRVIVDIERGRTSKSFLPRRLGGGFGHTRDGIPPVKEKKVIPSRRPMRRGGGGGGRGRGRGRGFFRGRGRRGY